MVELSIFLFFVGLFFGSFFLVIIDRFPKHLSPLTGRSRCDYCRHTLRWYDLIPVVSYLSTSGHCRYCLKKLSWWYPGFEILTALFFAVTPFLLGGTILSPTFFIELLFSLFVLSVFLLVFFIDLRYGLIPFTIVLPASGIVLIVLLLRMPDMIFNHLLAALGAALFFYGIHFATKGRGMGFGDVVLVFFLGLLLGFPGIGIGLYIAFLTGAIVSLILIFTGKKRMKGGTIPFGPFLILGALFVYYWESELLALITKLLLR